MMIDDDLSVRDSFGVVLKESPKCGLRDGELDRLAAGPLDELAQFLCSERNSRDFADLALRALVTVYIRGGFAERCDSAAAKEADRAS